MSSRVAMRGGFLARLTPRERNLIALLVVVFFAVATTLLFLVRRDRYHEVRENIESMRRSIELIQRQGGMYSEQLASKQKKEASIGSQELVFAVQVEQASTSTFEESKVRGEEEKQNLDLGGGLIKRLYTLKLQSVTLDELLKFLKAAETKQGHIIHTNRLMIRSPNHVEDRLNIEIDLATWELRRQDENEKDGDEDSSDSKDKDSKRKRSDSKRDSKGGS
ncbi:MAG: hypothetical protein ACPG4T_18240 [Nannocystaceae bacterium]